ncbi:MAG TPA: hypothetical protein VH989_00375 [Actinomycetota bacterium]
MPEVEISRADVEQFLSRFSVVVRDGDRETRHAVTMSRGDFERLGRSYRTPEEFVRACFAFLLARESNEQILASFDVSQIATYFPEFEEIIGNPPA